MLHLPPRLLRIIKRLFLGTFFLILYEMCMDNKAVRRIMGIPQEAIRIPELCSPTCSLSTRYRILTPKGMSVARNQKNMKK